MSSEASRMVSVRGLGKRYQIAAPGSRPGTLAEAALRFLRHPRGRQESFWALKGVDFDVHRGEVVGLIGHNGAGKSTLLKLLSRITEPTEGEIALYGRVGSLLEVGSGFHPDLTGRENIYVNGSVLGMTRREINACFDAIVDFAGVERFLDTPVKRYSSGMSVRLAFAVAAHLNPEILIVDEVLAVGDAEFQKRCLGKMQDVAHSGRTVFFVSHNLAAITALCTRAILLKGGRIHEDGPVSSVAATYQLLARSGASEDGRLDHVARSGTGAARFTAMEIVSHAADGAPMPLLYPGHDLRIEIDIAALRAVSDVNAALFLADSNTYRLVDISTAAAGRYLTLREGEKTRVTFWLRNLLLKPGLYSIGLWLGRPEMEEMDSIEWATVLEVAVDPDDAQSVQVGPGPYTCRFDLEVTRTVQAAEAA